MFWLNPEKAGIYSGIASRLSDENHIGEESLAAESHLKQSKVSGTTPDGTTSLHPGLLPLAAKDDTITADSERMSLIWFAYQSVFYCTTKGVRIVNSPSWERFLETFRTEMRLEMLLIGLSIAYWLYRPYIWPETLLYIGFGWFYIPGVTSLRRPRSKTWGGGVTGESDVQSTQRARLVLFLSVWLTVCRPTKLSMAQWIYWQCPVRIVEQKCLSEQTVNVFTWRLVMTLMS